MLHRFISCDYYRHLLSNRWMRYVINKKLKKLGVEWSSSVTFYGIPIISMIPKSQIIIGNNVIICSEPTMTALGVNHPVVLRTLRPNAVISIGNNTGISGGTICAANRVDIGNDCLIGANVIIADTDFHAISSIGRRHNNNPLDIGVEPIIIEDNVFIGTGVIILKGVRVGENSVIGAGSVVTKDVPANSIVAGNPAKLLRQL